jgi:glycosyltransferase involved in cell wall biosynthesis
VKVALIVRRFWPAVGGIERVALELASTLRELGHDPLVVAQRVDEGPDTWLTHTVVEAPAFAPFAHEGIAVQQFRLPSARRALLLPLAHEAIPLLPRVTRGRTRLVTAPWYARVAAPVLAPLVSGADVVHVLGGGWVSIAGVAAARKANLPVVVTPFVHRGYWRDDPASVRSYRAADRVLATLATDAGDLRALGVPAGKIDICGLPVRGVREPRPARDSRPLVLFVGARVSHKGHDLVRAAARYVWEAEPSARFAYVGPGPPLENRDPRELDVGAVDDAERDGWLARAWALVLPSASESFGLVVAEAWSAGTPVVTSDIGVLRELVERSSGGIAVSRDPRSIADAIVGLLADGRRRNEFGRSGFAFWDRELRPESVGRRHVEVYRRVRADGPD